MERARPVTQARGAESKKAYGSPNLVVYGSIAKLTQQASGSGADGNFIPGETMV